MLDRVAKKRHTAGDAIAARNLAEELGRLPLALEQAASFLIEMRWGFDQYREQLGKARPELLNEHREGGTDYPASVAKTWSITLNQLSLISRALLRIGAWFAPDAMPHNVFSADHNILAEALGEKVTVSDLAIERAFGELDKFSFIRLTGETVSMHPLLQAVEQDSLGADERERWLEWACRLFNAFAPERPEDVGTWHIWLPLSPHAEMLMEHTKRYHVDALSVALVANQFGTFLIARAASAQGEPLLERALAIREKTLGPDSPHVATILNSLAVLYHRQGRYREAEPLFERARAIIEKAQGPDYPELARSLQGLAVLYRRQGREALAEPLFERAQTILEKALGPEHPDVAWSVQGLAVLCREQGQYGQAEQLFKRVLRMREKALGPNHPELARSLQGLAELYRNQDRYEPAKPLFERARVIFEKVLGPEHPDMATCLESYALLLRKMGRQEEAASLEARARTIRAKSA